LRAATSGAEVLHDDVGLIAEPQRDLACPVDVEVDGDVAFAGVLLGVVAGDLAGTREGPPGHIPRWGFNLDHLGAQVE
jgi:hypothetical protein